MGVRRSGRPTSWSPTRFAWRSALGHRRGQTLALIAVAALVTACTSFAPVYDRAMQQALVDTLLAGASTAERSVRVVSDAVVDAGGASEARDPRELRAMVPPDVAGRLGPQVLGRSASVTPADGAVPPTGPLLWREGGCEHVVVLDGSCPDAAGEILVSETDVDNFDLRPGATTTVRTAVPDRPGVRLEVVGTYTPGDDEAWWQGQQLVDMSSISGGTDPTAAHDAWLTTEETFLEAPVLLGEGSQSGAVVLTASAGVDEVLALGDRLRETARDVSDRGDDLHVVDDLDVLTEEVRSQADQARRTVPLLMAPMAVLMVFVLWLVLAAATEQRRGEVAVSRLRGRGPAGAVALLLVELLPVLLLGVVPGVAVALVGGVVARSLLPGSAPFEAGPGFAVAVLLAIVAIVLTTVAAAVRVAREPLDGLVRRRRPTPGRWAFGARDAFLVAAVGTGVLAFVTGSLRGPLALAGPALLALLTGLLLAHVAAPAATVVGRRLLRRGHLVGGVTLLETGRRRETRALIAVITVACALGVFAVDALEVGERNRRAASEHDAGAPVVLRLAGRDLDGVRKALGAADPGGRRATPVMVSGTTLAVEPDGFRRIAFFPRGAPSDAQWQAIAAPEQDPVTLSGSRISLAVLPAATLTTQDDFGRDSEVDLDLVVTTGAGTRRAVRLGVLPQAGERTTLVAAAPECARGCQLVALELRASPGVEIVGDLELGDLRIDGRRVDWASSADAWNATEDEQTVIRPTDATAGDTLRLQLSVRGLYPAAVTPAWVPRTLSAVLPEGRRDAFGLEVTGIDGTDRTAVSAGRVLLLPTMPTRSALVDLDAITRGSEIAYDVRTEVWLVDDPQLVDAVRLALRERGIAVADVRRISSIRQAYDDTVATWSLALGSVVGPAVLLVALLVLLVLAVTGWRDRARDLAVLRLNGAGRRTTRRLASWAQLPAILLAVTAGVAAGLLGAALAMPDVPFFPSRPEVPVVGTATAWRAVLLVAGACFVLLPAASVLAGRAVGRRAHLERVKEAA